MPLVPIAALSDTGGPAEILAFVRSALTDGWEPVTTAELAEILAEAETLVTAARPGEQPSNWAWNLNMDVVMLRRLVNDRSEVNSIEMSKVLAVNAVAHRWHLQH